MDGFLVVNKLEGWTSNDVVVKVKHTLGANKVGHLGTLDPMATGVLVITIGRATKCFEAFKSKTKEYIATFEFGKLTDTLDRTGTIEFVDETVRSKVDRDKINKAIKSFIGDISQIPPKFSAKKINGHKAYELARDNKQVELKPCNVTIYEYELLKFDSNSMTANFRIVCSGGTYIRSLARDLGEKLSTYAIMTELKRTRVGDFLLENSVENAKINKENFNYLVNSIIKLDEYNIAK